MGRAAVYRPRVQAVTPDVELTKVRQMSVNKVWLSSGSLVY